MGRREKEIEQREEGGRESEMEEENEKRMDIKRRECGGLLCVCVCVSRTH